MSEIKPYGTVLIRAKQILDYLEQVDQPVNLQTIYTSLKTSKSTVLKILNTLCLIGFVKRDEETKKYSLGITLIRYGEAAKKSFSIISVAESDLIELNNQIGETIHLGAYDQERIIYIKKLNAKSRIILRSQVGHSVELYCSAMGKAYLAEQEEETVRNYLNGIRLEKRTENTICDKNILIDDLRATRKRGYAIDDQENEDDIYCIATSLKQKGDIRGLISVSSPVYRMSEEKKKKIITLLQQAKRNIEQKLTH
ncbi:IclR family transcriptional regulator [Sporolactobacillus sp. STSJ-5]|uniref:IclR family transcriptional regulator n=1 Tax=Sporolactobacillus sp. STSJ-5 TaxID=2965076 RepID=UPI00210624DA|nr:IclR family transcriptional regulator [Sporolactobacillus sp. STSJ-5]MCQ2009477.1 IclR family transcriptional regulator [Sporolactobacillus sp. STSJ-5]